MDRATLTGFLSNEGAFVLGAHKLGWGGGERESELAAVGGLKRTQAAQMNPMLLVPVLMPAFDRKQLSQGCSKSSGLLGNGLMIEQEFCNNGLHWSLVVVTPRPR